MVNQESDNKVEIRSLSVAVTILSSRCSSNREQGRSTELLPFQACAPPPDATAADSTAAANPDRGSRNRAAVPRSPAEAAEPSG